MCGFAGLLSTCGYTSAELSDHAAGMIRPLVHRGPDDCGIWTDEAAGIAFGFRRLSILDLSPHGHQPMRSPSGRFVMVFNGEVYNFVDLRRELAGKGYQFRGGSDTEVVLAAFDEWGVPAALDRFVGMFAIAVWDTSRRELLLIRDRLGKKPLYVYREPGLVTFGSELKALVAGPRFDRSIDRAALTSFFRYLYIPAPATIFEHTVKVPPGHTLTVTNPERPLAAAQPYWSLRDAALGGLAHPLTSEADAVDRLEAMLSDAVSCRMRSDVPVGALLSGGIDSSIVVTLMRKVSTAPVRTYAIGFDEPQFDESRHAASVARHLGTEHTELRLSGEDVRSLIPTLSDIFDEPFADPSQMPTHLVARLARQHVTVALSGDGGDELFGGYNRYVYGAALLPRLRRLPSPVRRVFAATMTGVAPRVWDRVGQVAALVPGLPGQRAGERMNKLADLLAAASTGEMYRSLVAAWQQPETVVVGAPARPDPTGEVLNEPEPCDLLDRMMLADQMIYLPDDLLAKVDRASMAVSLEVRSPLLDHRVVEFSWRLPRCLKLRGTTGKWILRQVLYRHLPRGLVERPKMGFSVPINRWLRGPLRPWAEALLDEDALRQDGLLNPQPVRRAWRDLQERKRQSGAAVWAVLMFQSWRARWNQA
jgi:asparagine synthase (glutamine-hydrolysing)